MTDPMNYDRAKWAEIALTAFSEEVGLANEPDTALGDLLCNLRHLADLKGFNFEAALTGAQRTYEAEVEEGGKAEDPEPGDREPAFQAVTWPVSMNHLVEMQRAVRHMTRLTRSMDSHLGSDDAYVHLMKAAIGVVQELLDNHTSGEQEAIEERLQNEDAIIFDTRLWSDEREQQTKPPTIEAVSVQPTTEDFLASLEGLSDDPLMRAAQIGLCAIDLTITLGERTPALIAAYDALSSVLTMKRGFKLREIK